MYYNEQIPLEQALEPFEDAHIRYEIIEDYHAAYLLNKLSNIALEACTGPEDE